MSTSKTNSSQDILCVYCGVDFDEESSLVAHYKEKHADILDKFPKKKTMTDSVLPGSAAIVKKVRLDITLDKLKPRKSKKVSKTRTKPKRKVRKEPAVRVKKCRRSERLSKGSFPY